MINEENKKAIFLNFKKSKLVFDGINLISFIIVTLK